MDVGSTSEAPLKNSWNAYGRFAKSSEEKRCENKILALELQVARLQVCLDEDCEHIVVSDEVLPHYMALLLQIEAAKKELYVARGRCQK